MRGPAARLAKGAQNGKSLQLFRTLMDSADDAIEVVDMRTLRFVDFNQKAFAGLGYTREEFLGLTVYDIDPTMSPQGKEIVQEKLRVSGPFIAEGIHRKKDGSTFPVEVSLSLSELDSGYVVAMARDVSARKAGENSLRRMLGALLHSQDEERKQLALDLQEGVGQYAAGLSLAIGQLRKCAERGDQEFEAILNNCRNLIRRAGSDVRTVSYLLHPPMIAELGLNFALRWLITGYEERSGIATTLEMAEDFPRLEEKILVTLFRIAQESLNNIFQHSGSNVATIRVALLANELVFEVSDRGKGLQVSPHLLPGGSGIGILGMQARAMDLNGRFELESAAARGVTVRVTLPLS